MWLWSEAEAHVHEPHQGRLMLGLPPLPDTEPCDRLVMLLWRLPNLSFCRSSAPKNIQSVHSLPTMAQQMSWLGMFLWDAGCSWRETCL